MNNNLPRVFIFGLVIISLISLAVYSNETLAAKVVPTKKTVAKKTPVTKAAPTKISKFASEKEFKAYLAKIKKQQSAVSKTFLAAPTLDATRNQSSVGEAAEVRVSQTNVQVSGIDEPDVVKVDGKNLYLSRSGRYWIMDRPLPVEPQSNTTTSSASSKIGLIAPDKYPQYEALISVFGLIPADQMKKISDVAKNGEMLLTSNRLMVMSYDGVYAFDITDPSNIREAWNIKYEKSNLVTSRLYNNDLYIVVAKYDGTDTCQIVPMQVKGKQMVIPCTSIYRPIEPNGSNATFHVFKVDSVGGSVRSSATFMGAGYQSTVYMSKENIYISYDVPVNQSVILGDFVKNRGTKYFSASLRTKVSKVLTYDIEESSKLNEIQTAITKEMTAKSEEDRLKLQNNLSNEFSDYMKTKLRDLNKTGVMKIGLNSLNIIASAEFPGRPLNQFSFDEYQGNLRVATTLEPNIYFYIPGVDLQLRSQSFSEVLVLDKNLKSLGLVSDLGKTERIYSVRFIGNRGYVVTFRQTDPFYVIDLSNSSKPEVKGELKIPGFSSYLHPLTETQILGLGQDEGKVKLSLFDVSNPSAPTEISKFLMDEYWSEAVYNHKAFLQDAAHNIFFIPASKGGYIFSYKDSKIELIKAIPATSIKRAVYIGNIMYFVAETSIQAYNMNTWEKISELDIIQK